jgi:hypothetical protein
MTGKILLRTPCPPSRCLSRPNRTSSRNWLHQSQSPFPTRLILRWEPKTHQYRRLFKMSSKASTALLNRDNFLRAANCHCQRASCFARRCLGLRSLSVSRCKPIRRALCCQFPSRCSKLKVLLSRDCHCLSLLNPTIKPQRQYQKKILLKKGRRTTATRKSLKALCWPNSIPKSYRAYQLSGTTPFA